VQLQRRARCPAKEAGILSEKIETSGQTVVSVSILIMGLQVLILIEINILQRVEATH